MILDYIRLAFATALVLLPGKLVARALGQRLMSATLAWSLACVFVAWSAVFILHRSIHLALVVLLAIAVGAAFKRRQAARVSGTILPWLTGVVLGLLLWPVEGAVTGDGLFHEARVRKLVDLTSLHLRTVDEFKDGGLHPGYAFPLWHGFLALVSWLSGLDPGTVVRHEPSVLVPIACLVAWEAGAAVFDSKWAGASVLAAQLALFCFAPGHGGSYATLALPGTTARQLLAPAAIALFFAGDWLGVAAAFGALTLTHPTYALFLLIPLLVHAVWHRAWKPLAGAIVPTLLALVWLKPIADETLSRNPGATALTNSLQQYKTELVVANDHHYRLAASVMGRSGAIAVASLVLLPVTALAIRRRWAAFALGGALLVLALMEVPWLFVHFSNAVSLSQSRRAAGFAPLPFALAGAAALIARRWIALPLALGAGIALQLLWPGDFAYGLRHGGPAVATWIALLGGAAALVAALILRPRAPKEHHAIGAAAVALLALPVLVHGFAHWSPRTPTDPQALSRRLVHNLRTHVPKGAIVLAPLETSYEVVADAPLYVVGLPVSHVANTKANDPYGRRNAVRRWIATKDVPTQYGATWAIRNGRLYRLQR
ncbi:MAG TPA: hypothetical protein VGU02_11210 [Gaiellaceae bacterium]|nr:hypothetical protein [Gaiellaceae bacterium]